jgi:hypothetical protein
MIFCTAALSSHAQDTAQHEFKEVQEFAGFKEEHKNRYLLSTS